VNIAWPSHNKYRPLQPNLKLVSTGKSESLRRSYGVVDEPLQVEALYQVAPGPETDQSLPAIRE
jgi:hypothetical protein